VRYIARECYTLLEVEEEPFVPFKIRNWLQKINAVMGKDET
jgi:hypothetical protein